MDVVLVCLVAYLLGGIPFGLVLVKLVKGIDIRTIGSGNVGATNASRAFGGKFRLVVFGAIYVLDFAKGCVPTLLAMRWLWPDSGSGATVLVGACAVLGHCASPYLGGRGGKGVATTTGVFAALELGALAVGLAAFFAVLAVTRQVFVGSLALGVGLAAAVVLREPASAFGSRLPVTALALAAAVFLFFTHRGNLRRAFQRRSAGAAGR